MKDRIGVEDGLTDRRAFDDALLHVEGHAGFEKHLPTEIARESAGRGHLRFESLQTKTFFSPFTCLLLTYANICLHAVGFPAKLTFRQGKTSSFPKVFLRNSGEQVIGFLPPSTALSFRKNAFSQSQRLALRVVETGAHLERHEDRLAAQRV